MPKVETIIYPVSDLAKAKTVFGALVGAEPYMDEVYYVGYHVDGQDIGLDPNGHRQGMTGPVCYWHVQDIAASLQRLLTTGAVLRQDITDVGGGKLTALVTDADGNVVGLTQAAED
ncbi:VOC family protein [Nonomuraea soli]|uniref:Putative enzyme related to lactoylglutathione lyase n=1 Tax=Nonomuraea soli TaxID=1032476 RepID=A0A7W0CKE9_9ACTN|nr:glyoxalase [Nonomuraea soli]MBA2892798.1 putative enzyme related to lactoylglutathione lyase [Nonomuraea soli]